MIKISVCGQNLLGEYSPTASDSIDYLEVLFSFSPDWYSLFKTAQFTQHGKTYNMAIEKDKCALPNEITDGRVEISVFGYETAGTKRITTLPFSMMIRKSGFVSDGETPVPPTPDLYSQLLSNIDAAIEKIPKKLSEFENDELFVKESALPTKLSQLEADSISGVELFIGASSLTIGGGSIHISKTDYGFYVDGNRIQNVGNPEDSADAANKGYVDDLVGDIDTALDSIISIENGLIGGDA